MATIDYNGLILQCQSLATLVVLPESPDKTDVLKLALPKTPLIDTPKTIGTNEG